jgi:ABC-type uncharacterized transport system permease subunit
MSDFPWVLMAVGGLGVFAVGVRKKELTDVGIGGCFVGSALFGYLAKSNDMYSWLQLAFAIAMVAFVGVKFRAARKRPRK